jgi:hypothetical protein
MTPPIAIRTIMDRNRRACLMEAVFDGDVIATATRFHRTHGEGFTGWVVRQNRYNYTDPISTKSDAKKLLIEMAHCIVQEMNES